METVEQQNVVRIEALQIDSAALEVRVGEQELRLTRKELELLTRKEGEMDRAQKCYMPVTRLLHTRHIGRRLFTHHL